MAVLKLWGFTLGFTLSLSSTFICMHLSTTKNDRAIKWVGSISSFIAQVLSLHLVLPRALILTLSCSLSYTAYILVPSTSLKILWSHFSIELHDVLMYLYTHECIHTYVYIHTHILYIHQSFIRVLMNNGVDLIPCYGRYSSSKHRSASICQVGCRAP